MLSRYFAILVITCCCITLARAQTQPDTQDVIRTETNLVQTGISVVDKKGNFIDGLRLEDFELRIDGKVQPISFLTRLTAGTNSETKEFNKTVPSEATTEIEERGRIVIFFIDDLHLSARSVQQTRQTILNFIANQMGPLDVVAIASASGQIGFLQQFTTNKTVLRAAITRLNHRPYSIHDTETVAMTEYNALRVEQGDRDAITYFTNQLLLSNNFNSPGGALGPPAGGPIGQRPATQPRSSGLSREMAERMVKERAVMMLKQSEAVTANTLLGLESLIRTSSKFTGRKLLFFLSDGFYLNDKNTGFATKLHELTDAAIRAGVVVYSLDTRGLVATIDAASNRTDPEGKLSRSNTGELTASQDPLNALAENTGGRALFDSDAFTDRVKDVIDESANYYLLSWRPETAEQRSAGFKRIEINIIGRPELTVRKPRGYLVNTVVNQPVVNQPVVAASSVDSDLKAALTAVNSVRNIPVVVSPGYLDTPDNGLLLTASVQAGSTGLSYGPEGKASVDLAGVVLNDQGKAAASFRTRLTVNALPPEMDQTDAGLIYNYKAKLAPGLYQVRTAVRDELSGKAGSASEWIEIPDLTKSRLTLSTLLLRRNSPVMTQAKSTTELPFSVDRRFSKSSQLGFFLFIYNANKSTPDLTAQVEIFRHGKSVVATPVRPLSMEGMTDLARIPYAGQFPLASLPSGRYELQVTINDRATKTTAVERVSFIVE